MYQHQVTSILTAENLAHMFETFMFEILSTKSRRMEQLVTLGLKLLNKFNYNIFHYFNELFIKKKSLATHLPLFDN